MNMLKLCDPPGCWAVIEALEDYTRESVKEFTMTGANLLETNPFDSHRWGALAAAREAYAEELRSRLLLMGQGIPIRQPDTPVFLKGFKRLVDFHSSDEPENILNDCLRGELQCWESACELKGDPELDQTTADLIYRVGMHLEASISLIISLCYSDAWQKIHQLN